MKRMLWGFCVCWIACSSKGALKDDAERPPETPHGDCFWSVKEGGAECVVTVGSEVVTRVPGTTDDFRGVEGYDERKWKCGEQRQLCGSTVECTCPFPVTAPDGGK